MPIGIFPARCGSSISIAHASASGSWRASLHPNDPFNQKTRMKVHQKPLPDKGKIEKLVLSLRTAASTNPEVLEKIRAGADYFARNAERMRSENPPSAPLCRLWCDRSGLQDCDRLPAKKIRHVPDSPGSQRCHRPPMLSPQRPLRGLPGNTPSRLTFTSISRTR